MERPRVLVADPTWVFDDKLPDLKSGRARGADATYKSVTPLEKLLELQLPQLHPDSLLFLWRVSAMPAEALMVVDAWGFEYKTELVWVKTSPGSAHHGASHDEYKKFMDRVSKRDRVGDHDSLIRIVFEEARRLAFGMGRYVRGAHETCLIARRGKGKVRNKSVRSVFFAPAGAHSEKPEEFYQLVEQLAEGPYHELFARRRRPGWTCEGDELPALPSAAPALAKMLEPYGDLT